MRTSRRLIASYASAALMLSAVVGCAPPADGARVARSTLVIGIDVSGSFRGKAHYESAIDFTANYLYAHIHGLGGLKQPTAVFVGSFGGEKPGETKSFQPIHTFQNKSVAEIAAFLRKEYPSNDGLTDFNPFFERVGTLVKRQNLVLSPLNIVMLTDGLPDTPSKKNDSLSKYKDINVSGLEYLSKNTTIRLLYPRPTTAVLWEKKVPRRRVRMWTVDDEVMATWRSHYHAGTKPEGQAELWKWISDNVDFRVRTGGIL
ncbi:MAG TPA: hypothetical protein VN876_04805 [Gemmatimonadaceae bacterium]|nr:hypothetical protein [Gemmatimonadaceae bacterium]